MSQPRTNWTTIEFSKLCMYVCGTWKDRKIGSGLGTTYDQVKVMCYKYCTCFTSIGKQLGCVPSYESNNFHQHLIHFRSTLF